MIKVRLQVDCQVLFLRFHAFNSKTEKLCLFLHCLCDDFFEDQIANYVFSL